jgi:hypothetical protein
LHPAVRGGKLPSWVGEANAQFISDAMDDVRRGEPSRRQRMISMKNDKAGSYRARAQLARQKAEAETVEALRRALLDNAQLWESMAEYEEKNLERHHC